MSGDGGADRRDLRASEGTHAALGGGGAASAGPVPALPGDDVAASVAIDELLPLAIPSDGRRGVGRPKNSPNLRTNKTFQAAVSRYGDPLIASIAWGNMDPAALIVAMRKIASDCGIKLGATVMDVVRFQEQCRSSAMKYGHAPRAATNEKGEEVLPIFVLGGGAGSTTNVQVNARASLEDRIEAEQEAKRNQSVTEIDGEVSREEMSHDQSGD
jgi:hypothetical protein